ncbi:MAG: hypothetical protein WA949_10780, partial [Phormidesmis sp.]
MKPLLDIISIVTKAAIPAASSLVQRNRLFIRVLKQCGLDPEHPPADFSGVYAYALVEYGLTYEGSKRETLLALFGDPEIKTAFKQAFDRWSISPLNEGLDQRLNWEGNDSEWNFVATASRNQDIDVQKEVTVFFSAFVNVVKRSQTPKEHLQMVMLSQVYEELGKVRSQLTQVSNLDSLPERIIELLESRFQALLPGAIATT